MDNHNYKVRPKYKTKEEIENEALGILHLYEPNYLKDLTVDIEPYDFIIEFLPEHIRKTEDREIEVVFEDLPKALAGYTQYDIVFLNRDKYDSGNVIDQRIMNFTIPHETYHALFHSDYLNQPIQNLQNPYFEKESKLERIKTLRRDLRTQENTNPFCTQANYFAACLTIPENRLTTALLEVYGKKCIASRDNFDCKICEIAKELQRFFNMNFEPIKIALEQYGLVKQRV